MEYIQLTQENLQKEHICCSMTEKKGDHDARPGFRQFPYAEC